MTAQSVSIYLIICVANVFFWFFFFSIAFNRKCFHDRSPLSFPSTRVLPFHNPEFNYIVQLKCCLWTHCTSSWAVGCWCQTLCLCGQVRRADSAFIRLQSPERQHIPALLRALLTSSHITHSLSLSLSLAFWSVISPVTSLCLKQSGSVWEDVLMSGRNRKREYILVSLKCFSFTLPYWHDKTVHLFSQWSAHGVKEQDCRQSEHQPKSKKSPPKVSMILGCLTMAEISTSKIV